MSITYMVASVDCTTEYESQASARLAWYPNHSVFLLIALILLLSNTLI